MNTSVKTLIVGYGNGLCGDDALGPMLVERLRACEIPGVTLRVAHQVDASDAAELAAFDRVIWIDAASNGEEAYTWTRLIADGDGPAPTVSHAADPAIIVKLAALLYGSRPECHLLAIRGYEFQPSVEMLSPAAARNLAAASDALMTELGRTNTFTRGFSG